MPLNQKRILMTPLNWGLGHATRCIPIIRALLEAGHEVHIGSDGAALELLKKEFEGLQFTDLPGYKVHYKGKYLILALIFQIPRILSAIWQEHRAIKKYMDTHHIDLIISDNRFGCRHDLVKSIFITHQLHLILPHRIMSWVATRLNKLVIRQFDELWVPDYAPGNNLTGKMLDPQDLPHIHYLGPLSRFERIEGDKMRDFVIILSGPEPARSVLETKLVSQIAELPYTFLIIRGLPGDIGRIEKLSPNAEQVNYLTSASINKVIGESRFVISRTGYTTIMDLHIVQKQAILIPTPGQTEQEYLGEIFKDAQQFVIQHQDTLDLKSAIKALFDKTFIPQVITKHKGLKVQLKREGLIP